MVRKKRVQHLDGRQRSMVENALHSANPPEAVQAVVVEYPPMLEYIWKLIYKDLNRTNTEKVVHTHTHIYTHTHTHAHTHMHAHTHTYSHSHTHTHSHIHTHTHAHVHVHSTKTCPYISVDLFLFCHTSRFYGICPSWIGTTLRCIYNYVHILKRAHLQVYIV